MVDYKFSGSVIDGGGQARPSALPLFRPLRGHLLPASGGEKGIIAEGGTSLRPATCGEKVAAKRTDEGQRRGWKSVQI